MSLLNRESNYLARTQLFKHLTIFATADPDPLQRIRDACAFLAQERNSCLVQHLTIDVQRGLGTSEQDKRVVLEQLFASCGLLRRVTSLSILLPPSLRVMNATDRPLLIQALSATIFPLLKEFSINVTNLSGLDQFWADHPTLMTLRVLDPLPFNIIGLSSPLPRRLPFLTRVELHSDVQSRVIEGCAVTDLHLHKMNSNHPFHLVANLSTCTATIERFTFGDIRIPRGPDIPCVNRAPSALYTHILPQLPRLQYLCIIDWLPDGICYSGRRKVALSALASMDCLQVFEWRGNIPRSVQAAFLDSRCCTALREVSFEFRLGEHIELAKYTRMGTEDAWEELQRVRR